MIFEELRSKSFLELVELCKKMGVPHCGTRQNLCYEILRHELRRGEVVIFDGFFELIIPQNGYEQRFGFLRDIQNNFIQTYYDTYVSAKLIKEYDLRQGDHVVCEIILPKDDQKFFCLSRIISVNDRQRQDRVTFESKTATYPTRQIVFERPKPISTREQSYNLIARIVDLFVPMGFGQRALIVAQPKSGKTTVLHSIATSMLNNYKDVKLIILLIGERPEEVTEMKKIAPGAEIVFSTFDEPVENHVKTAELIIERAKRLVEYGQDVVVLMDSLTRLGRAYNTVVPSSGRVLTGGIEPLALQKVKKILGGARNTEEGGSLTIVATVLTLTGFRMDDSIFEELKGTGNSECVLSRILSEKKIFPAIEVSSSGTRRPEEMMKQEILQRIRILGNFLVGFDDPAKATKFLVDKISITENNSTLLLSMQQ